MLVRSRLWGGPENENKLMRNIQLIRNVLHNSTTELAESKSANMNYEQYITMAYHFFRKYSKYEHMTLAQVAKEGRSRNTSTEEILSGQQSVKPSKSVQRSTVDGDSGSGSSFPTVDTRGQVRLSGENLKATARQISDMGILTTKDQVLTNDRTEERRQRLFSATQLVNHPDPKRVQAIVQQHIKTSVEKKIREHLAVAASSRTNPEQITMAGRNINDKKEQERGQNAMKVTAIQKGISVPRSLLDDNNVRQGDEGIDKARLFAGNVLNENVIAVTPGHADMANRSTDNQREQLRYPDDGNVDTHHGNVQVTDVEAQQNGDGGADTVNQETTFQNSGEVEKKSENSQAPGILENEIGQSVRCFQKACDREPILNGPLWVSEKDNSTYEEALRDLQDLLEGKRPTERSARPEETLTYMESDGKECEDGDIEDLEPAAKKQKTFTLRE